MVLISRFEKSVTVSLIGLYLLCMMAGGLGCQTSPYNPDAKVTKYQWPKYKSKYNSKPYNTSNRDSRWPAGWVPTGKLESRSRWKGIVIHHSADDYGDATYYDRAHRSKGWDALGYHFVINNGHNGNGRSDGTIEVGSRWPSQREGAHCRIHPGDDNYWNEHTIGICLVGNFENHPPSSAQWQSLVKLVDFLKQRYNIPDRKIVGHRDVKATKCPGRYFSFYEFRRRLGQSQSPRIAHNSE